MTRLFNLDFLFSLKHRTPKSDPIPKSKYELKPKDESCNAKDRCPHFRAVNHTCCNELEAIDYCGTRKYGALPKPKIKNKIL